MSFLCARQWVIFFFTDVLLVFVWVRTRGSFGLCVGENKMFFLSSCGWEQDVLLVFVWVRTRCSFGLCVDENKIFLAFVWVCMRMLVSRIMAAGRVRWYSACTLPVESLLAVFHLVLLRMFLSRRKEEEERNGMKKEKTNKTKTDW